jgi:hypothetical protein
MNRSMNRWTKMRPERMAHDIVADGGTQKRRKGLRRAETEKPEDPVKNR